MAPSSLSVKCASLLNQIVWVHLSEGENLVCVLQIGGTVLKRVEIRECIPTLVPANSGPQGGCCLMLSGSDIPKRWQEI